MVTLRLAVGLPISDSRRSAVTTRGSRARSLIVGPSSNRGSAANNLADRLVNHRADFQQQMPAGLQPLGRLRQQPLDDLGAARTGHQGLARLEVLHVRAAAAQTPPR